MDKTKREIPVQLLGHASLDPYYGSTSAARGAMFLSHIGQAPIVEGNEPRRIMTGMELRYAENTFDIRFPVDCTVLRFFRKYAPGYGNSNIKHNPLTSIFYENYYDEYKEIGVINVPDFLSFHQEFGYKLKRNKDVWDTLSEGDLFAKDTIIADSTAVKDNGLYGMGVNATAAFMSMPGTIEDGMIFSEEFITEKFAPRTYTTAVGSAGKKAFFLNMYGDDENYKPFPDIGERIRDDGVIFATRDLDDDLAPAEMTPRALREFDRTFDRAVIGAPGSIVKDIKVYHDDRQNPSFTPEGMDTQLRKYYDALCDYYRQVQKFYFELKRRRKDKLKITEEFHQLVVESFIYLPQNEKKRKLTRMYRLEQLDEWRVELTYETLRIPGEAYKYTDLFGGKGIACQIKPRSEMPVDSNGNICDVVIFGGSTMRRTNYGRLYEHGFNATSRDLAQKLRVEIGLDRHAVLSKQDVAKVLTDEFTEYAFNKLLGLYKIITPTMYKMVKEHPNIKEHVTTVLVNGFSRLYTPVDDPLDTMGAINELINSEYKPLYGPVTYIDQLGNKVVTKDNILTGPLYLLLLEKIGEDWSSVASVKTQQFGLPAKLNNTDRSSTPGRESAVRAMGESESRSYNATIGPEATVELIDLTNNPEAHLAVMKSILTAQRPSNIHRAVDRTTILSGKSRPINLLAHLLECRGIRFKYSAK